MEPKHYKRNLREMAPVRRLGMQLLTDGAAQAEVVRELGVSRTTAWNWAAALARRPARATAASDGRVLSAPQRRALDAMLDAGARSHGFPSDGWSMARIAVLIEVEFGLVCSSLHVWRMLAPAPPSLDDDSLLLEL